MLARCCDTCDLNWPAAQRFETCPKCGRVTRSAAVRSVMSDEDARRQINQIEFVKVCRKRDAERSERGEPSPEEIGRQQAIRDLEQIKELGRLYGES